VEYRSEGEVRGEGVGGKYVEEVLEKKEKLHLTAIAKTNELQT